MTNKCLPFVVDADPTKTACKGKVKQSCNDDIPPVTPSDVEEEVNHLHDLQDHLFCVVHSRCGIKTYCHIELVGDNNEGGHCKFSCFLTLWAQYIVSQRIEQNEQKLTMVSATWPCNKKLPAKHQTF